MKSVFTLGLVSAVALLGSLSVAQADDKVGVGAGDILVHLRALGAFPDASGHDQALNGKIDIGNSYVPEVDASYFFTNHIAAEIIAGTTRHKVEDKAGSGYDLGHVWLLPPTVTAQYHPLARNVWDPYVGAGLNYSIFYGAGGADIGGQPTKVDYKNGVGYALQGGVNYEVSKAWFVNVDVKKIFVSTSAKVELNGNAITNAHVAVDPLLVGLGVGYRF
jgi:outer membrane protein